MDAVVSQIQDAFEGDIDFEGQRLSEMICTYLLSISAFIALLVGLVKQDIHLTMWVGVGGIALTMMAVVPPWPFYNQNPQPWIGSTRQVTGMPIGSVVVGGEKVN